MLPPIYSPLSVMEPADIAEITPPTLLALSTVGSRVHHPTMGSPSISKPLPLQSECVREEGISGGVPSPQIHLDGLT